MYARLQKEDPKELKVHVGVVKGSSAEGKKIFLPKKVKTFGFGHFPRERFAHFVAKQGVSFTKLASYPTQVNPNPNPAGPKPHSRCHQVPQKPLGEQRRLLSDKTKARQVESGRGQNKGCWRVGVRRSRGVPGMLSPARRCLVWGGGISNWQPGLGCPFCGVLFNCTG